MIELLCLKEATNLILRDKKYWLRVAHLYLSSLKNFERAKIGRTSYFFCRDVDDVLDNDKKFKGNRLEYALEILAHVKGESTSNLPIVKLFDFSIKGLEKIMLLDDNPRKDFADEIEIMIYDYKRSQERRLLSQAEIEEYYLKTFIPVLNIALIGAGSKYRGKDVANLAYLMGQVHSIRDLKKDLSEGTINIPREIIKNLELKNLHNSKEVKMWIENENQTIQKRYEEFKYWLNINGDKGAKWVCYPSLHRIKTYLKNKHKNERGRI